MDPFNRWDSLEELINNIETKVDKTLGIIRVVLKTKNRHIFFIHVIMSIDWILRRKMGLLKKEFK